jgi:hypothetical protein
MWVFDGNGFTMACLAVWIRNEELRAMIVAAEVDV